MKPYVLVSALLGILFDRGVCVAFSESQISRDPNAKASLGDDIHRESIVLDRNVSANNTLPKLAKRLPQVNRGPFYWFDRSAQAVYQIDRGSTPALPRLRVARMFYDRIVGWLEQFPDPSRPAAFGFFASEGVPLAQYWITVSWNSDPPNRTPDSRPWAIDGSDPSPLETRVVQGFGYGGSFLQLRLWLYKRLVNDRLAGGFKPFHGELYNAMTQTTFAYSIALVHLPEITPRPTHVYSVAAILALDNVRLINHVGHPGMPRLSNRPEPPYPRPPLPQVPHLHTEDAREGADRPRIARPEPPLPSPPSPPQKRDEGLANYSGRKERRFPAA